jgi:hypothetical protein
MPSSYTIDGSQRTVFTTSSGIVTDPDLLGVYERLRSDPDFHADYDQVCDFTRAASVRISTQAVRRLALDTPFADGARLAIVAPNAVVYGLARMYRAQIEAAAHDAVRIFPDLTPACEWLGVRAPGRRSWRVHETRG